MTSGKPFDIALARELAAELGYWPASTDAQSVTRYRAEIADSRRAVDTALTPADAALRERITELGVHIPCGNIRGPVRRINPYHPRLPIRWQSCPCEDNPVHWKADVSREKDLCIVCFRATAGGTSRWAWLACKDCRDINDALGSLSGRRPLALGRHSIMNGIAVRGGQSQEAAEAQIQRLLEFLQGDRRLDDWGRTEYRRLATAFDPQADVPLPVWQEKWPPGEEASRDAFSRLLGESG